MQHEKIAEALALTARGLDRLAKEPGPKEPTRSTWEDWSLRDVFGHLTAWVTFATVKVSAIRDQKPFDEVADIETFNRAAYEKGAGLKLAQARKNLSHVLAELGTVAKRFSEAELDQESWPTGFRMSLTRYLVLDAFVHPLQHILYHALKTGQDETFLKTLEEARPLLAWYDPGMDILGSFGDFFQGEGARWQFFGAVDTHAFPAPIQNRIRELGTDAKSLFQ
jgi:hypothetical protein